MFQRRACVWVMILTFAATAWGARRPGDPLKPGFNLFSKQDDVQIGEENAKQVLQKYEVVKNQSVQDYVKRVGQKLADAPEAKASGFNFTFTVVNVDEVNAFALPGGPMFLYTGLFKVLDNEAQLAGVMGHEMSHVILRHGTHEATKANGVALLAGGLGSLLGGGRLAESIVGLGANSMVLKFSRDAESEADALGSRLMAAAGYNPVEMAKFFEKLNASGGQHLQILSDHPNPGNREAAIQAEMKTFPARQFGYETGQFARVKKEVASLPAPAKKPPADAIGPGSGVPAPGDAGKSGASDEWRTYRGQGYSIRYPAGWQVFGEANAADVTLAPRDGVVSRNGGTQVGFGAMIGQYLPQYGRGDLRNATTDLLKKLQNENSQMNVTSGPEATTVVALHALVTKMRSNSAFGGAEVDTLVTVMRGQRLWYAVFIAPQNDQPRVEGTFRQMLESVAFGE